MEEDSLVRPPKGFSADTPHIEAIKLRHYFGLAEVNLKKRPPKDLRARPRRAISKISTR